MSPTQSVVYTTLVSMFIFLMAGDNARVKTSNAIGRLSGKAPAAHQATETGPRAGVSVMVGWATVFLILIALTDVPTTAQLGSSFGWLLLLSIFLAFGADAFHNISAIVNPTAKAGTK